MSITESTASILEITGASKAPTQRAKTPFLVFPGVEANKEETQALGLPDGSWISAFRLDREGFDFTSRPIHALAYVLDTDAEPNNRGQAPIVASLITEQPLTDENEEPITGSDLELGKAQALEIRNQLLREPEGAFAQGWINLA